MWSFWLSKLRQYLVLIKYLSTSLAVYLYILAALYLLVDVLQIDPVPAYIAIYLTAYAMEYMLTLRLVFNELHRGSKVLKYVTYVGVFLGFSTLLYAWLLSVGVYYLLATLLTAGVLMPVRFVVNKYWVYC